MPGSDRQLPMIASHVPLASYIKVSFEMLEFVYHSAFVPSLNAFDELQRNELVPDSCSDDGDRYREVSGMLDRSGQILGIMGEG